MALVTDAEVKVVIPTTRDTTSFIETADLIVSENLADKGLSSNRLKQIELYLAAHFVALVEESGNIIKARIGEATEEYNNKTGMSFEMTRYGQQAIALDTTGTLKAASRVGQNAQFRIV